MKVKSALILCLHLFQASLTSLLHCLYYSALSLNRKEISSPVCVPTMKVSPSGQTERLVTAPYETPPLVYSSCLQSLPSTWQTWTFPCSVPTRTQLYRPPLLPPVCSPNGSLTACIHVGFILFLSVLSLSQRMILVSLPSSWCDPPADAISTSNTQFLMKIYGNPLTQHM